jgi:hypothetical protein
MKYFVLKRVVRHKIYNPHGLEPEIWDDDKTDGTGRFTHKSVVKYQDSQPGDLVFFYELTDGDLQDWYDSRLHGEWGGSVLSYFQSKFMKELDLSIPDEGPAVILREQDFFPEGEG